MGTIGLILPYLIEGFKLAPTLIKGGMELYDGIVKIWNDVTDAVPATETEQKEYDSAMEAAFQALMASTDDVKEEGDLA